MGDVPEERKLIYDTECLLCLGHPGDESLREDACQRFLKGRESQSNKTGVRKNPIDGVIWLHLESQC